MLFDIFQKTMILLTYIRKNTLKQFLMFHIDVDLEYTSSVC